MRILFCLLLLSLSTAAQDRNVFFDDEVKAPTNWGVNGFKSKIRLFVSVDTNAKSISPFNSLPADPLGSVVYLNGGTAAKVTTRVRKDSLSYYRYSIIENDTLVKVWDAKLTKVDFVWNEYSDLPGYLTMDLGISAIKGKKITIKIYRLPRVNEVSVLVIYNKPLPMPKLLEAILVVKSTKPSLKDLVKLKGGERVKLTDTTTGIFIKKQKTDLDFAQNILLKYTNGKISDTVKLPNNWQYDSDDCNPIVNIETANFKNPGDYEILFQTYAKPYKGYEVQKPVSVLKFTVLPKPLVFSTYHFLLFAFAVIIFALVVILVIRRANKKKQLTLSLKAESAKNELNTVRAQLNPHFVFNALSGIQNLMNNGTVEEANHYLGKFANLTRIILDDHEFISIEDEIKLLQDYLSMEQLRFAFTVDFKISGEENLMHTEIPTMLLQPFVENAVKHGIAPLKGNGKVEVSLIREQQNIVLMVTDNGNGFDQSVTKKGLGLKLSEKRIALLNENYKNCPIELHIDSSSGTCVRITLTNWLT